MSPTASEQFGKIASIAVIMTLLPYIYSSVAIKIIGRDKMSRGENVFYTFVGLIAAFYSMAAMIGSDPSQTRWALMFVISTVIFTNWRSAASLTLRKTTSNRAAVCLSGYAGWF